MNERTIERTIERTNERTNQRMNVRTNDQRNEVTNERTKEQANERTRYFKNVKMKVKNIANMFENFLRKFFYQRVTAKSRSSKRFNLKMKVK